jgi:hypothetical protein
VSRSCGEWLSILMGYLYALALTLLISPKTRPILVPSPASNVHLQRQTRASKLGIMQSKFSRSYLQAHLGCHASLTCNPPPPQKSNNRKDISNYFICTVHPPFQPSITLICSPSCKVQVYFRPELRNHMLDPHPQRARVRQCNLRPLFP